MAEEKKRKSFTRKNEFLKDSRDILTEMNDNISRYNQGLKEATNFTQKMTENNAKIVENAIKLNQEGALSGKQTKAVADLSKQIVEGSIDEVKSKRMQNDLEKKLKVAQDKKFTKQANGLQLQLNMLKDMDEQRVIEKQIQDKKEAQNQALGAADKLTGGMASNLKQGLDSIMKMNPAVAVLAVTLAATVALLTGFNDQQKAIGDEFGKFGVNEFRNELAGARTEFTRMGLEANEALTSAKALSMEFGVGFDESIALTDSIGNIAKSTALGTSEAAKLVGLFTEIGGLSEQGAENLAKQTESLAVANGVAPSVVLKDIAANSETFAKFSGDGAEGLARAAIQARKLGVEFADIANAAEGLLDFQGSLNKEVEASVLLGRNLNLQKARELALTGDLEGFQTEILKQVGSQAEFDKMNVLQKKALAEATGLTVQQLSKMVSKEKEAVTLQGALSKQKISDIIPEETITATAALLAQFQALSMELAASFGPAINFTLSIFSGLASAIQQTIGLGPALVGLLVAIKGKAMALAIANAASAVATFFKGASLASLATGGFTMPLFAGIAAGAVTAMLMSINKAKSVGDLGIDPNGGPIVASPTMGGVFQGKKGDGLSMGPEFGVNGDTSAGTIVQTDTSALESKQNETNVLLTGVLNTLDGALSGPRPALARAMGSATGDAVNGMA
tara:strand:+ start:269 stop:2308 length:2040 start_codon:yes stop_codon:yes gene_type:complete